MLKHFQVQVCSFSGNGKLLLATQSARSMFGLSRRDIDRTTLGDLFAGDQEVVDLLTSTFDKTNKSNEAQKATIEVHTDFNDPDVSTVFGTGFRT